jgi:multidrug efflux pump subunit AcrB
VQRSLAAGIILMLPSLVPVFVVFGLMGWLGIIVDIGTVMTPAVALGVSVDDIVHFMLQFRRASAAGADRRQAVMAAYHHCGRAMYQSWGVIGLGLSVFALSPFTPTQRFGYMMIALLTAALFGNLLLLPALLAGPLGAIYCGRVRKSGDKEGEKLASDPSNKVDPRHIELQPVEPHRLETPSSKRPQVHVAANGADAAHRAAAARIAP